LVHGIRPILGRAWSAGFVPVDDGTNAGAPGQLSLCPQTTSRQEANEWLTAWTAWASKDSL
jgi:hypothetical protein